MREYCWNTKLFCSKCHCLYCIHKPHYRMIHSMEDRRCHWMKFDEQQWTFQHQWSMLWQSETIKILSNLKTCCSRSIFEQQNGHGIANNFITIVANASIDNTHIRSHQVFITRNNVWDRSVIKLYQFGNNRLCNVHIIFLGRLAAKVLINQLSKH